MAQQKFASGSQYRVAYVAETVPGTTPATPAMVELPRATFTLTPTKELMTSSDVTSDGLPAEDRHGNISLAGDLTADLRHGTFDDLIAGVFGRTAWTANVVQNGAAAGEALPSFTFEKGNVGFSNYERYTGVRVSSMEVSIEPGQLASLSFGLVGAGVALSTTPLDADVTVAVSPRAMSHIGGSVSVGGIPATFTSFTLMIDNGAEPANAIGSNVAADIVRNASEVTFSGTAYIEDDDQLYNQFINELTTNISVVMTDGTDNYTFYLPVAKINSADRPLTGGGLLFVNFTGKAYRHADGYSARLTRTPL